jgi:hypothetical protein
MAFVMTLSYERAILVRFIIPQSISCFLKDTKAHSVSFRGHRKTGRITP